MLDRLEREAGESGVGTDDLAVILAAQCVCGILDHRNAGLVRKLVECIHIANHACVMHEHDRLGPLRDLAADRFRIEQTGIRIHVSPDDLRAGNCNGRICRLRGHRCTDHLIARTDIQQKQCQVQCSRSGLYRKRVLISQEASEPVLKFPCCLTLGDVAAVQHILDCGHQFFSGRNKRFY